MLMFSRCRRPPRHYYAMPRCRRVSAGAAKREPHASADYFAFMPAAAMPLAAAAIIASAGLLTPLPLSALIIFACVFDDVITLYLMP